MQSPDTAVRVRKTVTPLADGRELVYYDTSDVPRTDPDRRDLDAREGFSQLRHDPLLDEWVIVAGHRQERSFRPADDQCPLCPSTRDRLTEIPAADYEVVVFENRFPALPGRALGEPGPPEWEAGAGRCEVVCFSPVHGESFADLTPRQAGIVLAAWTDRTAALGALPGVRQVFCFENRGSEIGATLSHPHGQIYAYPFVTPRTSRMLANAAAHRERTGRNLFDDVLAAARDNEPMVVAAGRHWTAFVPFAARWPYEVHLYPHRRVPDLTGLREGERAEFCELYLDVLRRFDRLFGVPAPYVSAWHQAPSGACDFALHLELFTVRRAPDKLKYLAGSESGMGVATNDVTPERAARALRDAG
jgi:UDPglucose--hexose-1-phosphate uridylyltransferase